MESDIQQQSIMKNGTSTDSVVCGARLEFKRIIIIIIIDHDDRKVLDSPLELEEALYINGDEEVKIASL
jgi:hypothetical protein